jgi:hypothetical protein
MRGPRRALLPRDPRHPLREGPSCLESPSNSRRPSCGAAHAGARLNATRRCARSRACAPSSPSRERRWRCPRSRMPMTSGASSAPTAGRHGTAGSRARRAAVTTGSSAAPTERALADHRPARRRIRTGCRTSDPMSCACRRRCRLRSRRREVAMSDRISEQLSRASDRGDGRAGSDLQAAHSGREAHRDSGAADRGSDRGLHRRAARGAREEGSGCRPKTSARRWPARSVDPELRRAYRQNLAVRRRCKSRLSPICARSSPRTARSSRRPRPRWKRLKAHSRHWAPEL